MTLRKKFQDIQLEMNEIAVERFDEIHGLILAILTGSNILNVGSPGTAKSLIGSRFIQHIKDGVFFQRLLTTFTTPEAVFGPPSLKELKEGRYVRVMDGMLPTADLVFLDEVFKANSGILNSLLECMNERIYSEGAIRMDLPLLVLIGASNEIPNEDDKLGAMYDRFHLKYQVDPIREPGSFMKMLEMPEELPEIETYVTRAEILKARDEVKTVDIPKEIIQKMAKLRHSLSSDTVHVTDRTYKSSIKILKAEAYMKGHKVVEEDDMDVLRHVYWSDPDHRRKVYTKILHLVNPEKEVILAEYEKLMEVAAKVFAIDDHKKQIEAGIESGEKFRRGRDKIIKKIDEMKRHKKDTAEVQHLLNQITEQQTRIFTEACGIPMGGKS